MNELLTYKKQKTKVEKRSIFNPFPGLRPFSTEESHLFFGREGQSEEVIEKLAKHKFVAVIGASGSGKSSLMYCGITPILFSGFMPGLGSQWRIITARPGGGPIQNLANAIIRSEKSMSSEETYYQSAITASVLRSSSAGLIEVLKQFKLGEKENILVQVDQFEELFRFKASSTDYSTYDESLAFVKLLLYSVRQQELPVYVILTMRSDFVGECSNFQELTELINESHYLIPMMTRQNFYQAIIGPIAVGGGKINERLVSQLLNDVGDNPDQLPILQHALMRTWDYWTQLDETDQAIDIHHYEAIGKMEKALSQHANEAYDELSPRGKEICESIFKSLTEKSSDARGVRRPTSIRELAEIASAYENEVIAVVEVFRQPGRSFLAPSIEIQLESDTIIDVSHESLMRIWEKLKIWVEEEVNSVKMYLRLAEAAEAFQKSRASLWRPPDLHLAVGWHKKQRPTLTWALRYEPTFERAMAFLKKSEEVYEAEENNKIRLQKKALRRSRIFALVLGAAAVLSLGLMIYSFILQQEAVKQQMEAETQKVIAERNQKAAESQRKLANDKTKEAENQRLKAEEERKKADEERQKAENQAQIAENEKQRAEAQKQLAEQQKQIAETKTREADLAAAEAKKQQQNAENASNKAFELRMLSIAQSMSVKSLQLNREIDKKAIVAFQAYIFNKRYNGSPYNPDIYTALYHTLKLLNPRGYNELRGHQAAVRSIIFSKNGENIFSTGNDGKIFLWNISHTDSTPTLIAENQTANRVIALNNSQKNMVCSNENNTLQAFNLHDLTKLPLKPNKKVQTKDGYAQSISFLSDTVILAVTTGYSVFQWNINTDSIVPLFQTKSRIKSFAISNDKEKIALGTEAGYILIKSLKNNTLDTIPAIEKNNPVCGLCFDKNATTVFSGDIQGVIHIWDIKTKDHVISLSGHNARIVDIQFSHNDSIFATASFDGTVLLWQTSNYNNQPIILRDENSWVWSIAFNLNDTKIITGFRDGKIQLWQTNPAAMAKEIYPKITRDFTEKEWKRYVAPDIDYEKTRDNLP